MAREAVVQRTDAVWCPLSLTWWDGAGGIKWAGGEASTPWWLELWAHCPAPTEERVREMLWKDTGGKPQSEVAAL